MRLLQFLHNMNETAKDRYMQMFANMPREFLDHDITGQIQIQIQWAIEHLKREDRIVWYLRLVRAYFSQMFLSHIEKEQKRPIHKRIGSTSDQRLEELKNYFLRIVTKFKIQSGKIFSAGDATIKDIQSDLMHFLTLPIPTIQNYVFQYQSFNDMFTQFDQLEQEWKERERRMIPREKTTGAELLIDFNNGLAWWDLKKPGCRIEGEAMGHCGNSGETDESVTVLSLREKVVQGNQAFYKPHVTFILDKTEGSLGEMKGFGNERPAPKYYPYIVALLQKPFIKRIDGGGYRPQNNFDPFDLPEEDLQKISHLITPGYAKNYLNYKYGVHVEKAERYIMKDPEFAVDYARSKEKRWIEAEPYIMKDPESAYRYAFNIIVDRWPEAEPYIMKNPIYAARYARRIMQQRWPAAEPYILQNNEAIIRYLRLPDFHDYEDVGENGFKSIGKRWLEAEPHLAKDAISALEYAEDHLKGRFPAGEDAIASSMNSSYIYATDVLKGRFPKGEKVISKDAQTAWNYAIACIPDKIFPAAEPVISQNPRIAYFYAIHALKRRWPEAEPTIAKSESAAKLYLEHFPEARQNINIHRP